MRLTIIKQDETVCIDDICFTKISWEGTPSDVHALQWYGSSGELEFISGLPNQKITELPIWANNAITAWETAHNHFLEQKQNSPEFSLKEKNKLAAVGLLGATDWAVLPDVADSAKSNPYLINVQEFLDFRNIVRPIAINPPETSFDFPPLPKAQWSDR